MSENENLIDNLPAALAALLFTSPEPVLPSQLSSGLGISIANVEIGLRQLEIELSTTGFRLQRQEGRVQLTTAPNMAGFIERFWGLEATSKLSRAAIETLAIVAYQQPVTRPFIEELRGVSVDGVMRSLIGKGLVQEIGRAEGPGRPILYGTTVDFLEYFGINSLSDLPPIDHTDNQLVNGHDDLLKE